MATLEISLFGSYQVLSKDSSVPQFNLPEENIWAVELVSKAHQFQFDQYLVYLMPDDYSLPLVR